MAYSLLTVIVIALFLFNIVATIVVWRDFTLETPQKYLQTVVVWLLPLIGAALFIHLTNSHAPEAIPKFLRFLLHRGIHRGNRHRDEDETHAENLTSSRRLEGRSANQMNSSGIDSVSD